MVELVAIVGINGKQAGAAASKLLKKGIKVRGVVRDPASSAWADKVEMVAGDMKDVASLKKAFEGVDSVYFVTPFNVDDEVVMGKTVIDAAKEAGVSHVVFSSVSIADQAAVTTVWGAKIKIETHLAESGVPFTVVRPPNFMDNFLPTGIFPIQGTALVGMLPPDLKTQFIAVEDIGYVVAEIIEKRGKFLGQTVELAGDDLSCKDMAAILGNVNGATYTYSDFPLTYDAVQQMVGFISTHECLGDIPKLKEDFPELQNWEQFVRANNLGKQ
ncbi:NAD(P)-binding protein, partial [Hesseltinella vesiculosa]